MLKVKDFTVTHTLSSSEGKTIRMLEDEDLVALYDSDTFGEDEVNKYITNGYIAAKCDFPEDIVVLPADTWTKIQGMIKDSYDLTPKNRDKKQERDRCDKQG